MLPFLACAAMWALTASGICIHKGTQRGNFQAKEAGEGEAPIIRSDAMPHTSKTDIGDAHGESPPS